MIRSSLQRVFKPVVLGGGAMLISALFLVATASSAAVPGAPFFCLSPAVYV